ncbi:MAG: RusA family crossover junction endodeoxyribonuclease [Hyphomicrobiaceae bacterium]
MSRRAVVKRVNQPRLDKNSRWIAAEHVEHSLAVVWPDFEIVSRPERPAISLIVPGIPPSKKNSQQIRRHGRRRIVTSSTAARDFEMRLAQLARNVISEGLADRYVAVQITIDEDADLTAIDIYDRGPKPTRGRTHTKRDIHNCADVVMDALQGSAFNDDRQARAVLTSYGRITAAEFDGSTEITAPTESSPAGRSGRRRRGTDRVPPA